MRKRKWTFRRVLEAIVTLGCSEFMCNLDGIPPQDAVKPMDMEDFKRMVENKRVTFTKL
jgi:hypothetical protein